MAEHGARHGGVRGRPSRPIIGVRHALAVSNGTAALHLMCMAAGLGPGDEVVVPSMTFVATVNAVPTRAHAGLRRHRQARRAVAVGCELRAAIGPRTQGDHRPPLRRPPRRAAELAALAQRRGLALLEDAAHAAGSRLDGRPAARWAGRAFWFFSNKNLAIGEGGMVATDDEALAAQMRLLRSHGMTTLSWDRHRGHASELRRRRAGLQLPARRASRHVGPPPAGAPRRATTRAAPSSTPAIASGWATASAARSHRARARSRPTTCSRRARPRTLDRAAFRAALHRDGVQTSVHYPPAHGFSIYAQRACDLPLTDAYGARTVTLPLFAHMTLEQQDLVVGAVATALAPVAAR